MGAAVPITLATTIKIATREYGFSIDPSSYKSKIGSTRRSVSPKLFTASLQWMMKSLACDEKSIRVDKKFLRTIVLWTASSPFRKVPAKQRQCSMNSAKREKGVGHL
ncbi:hypothetical protein KIN20_013871 [Parelaphostrongylus tenuis]|uniref:Uncharacterized protein n=1 Tax=Parelaphostrongylus tenuis TaxID=148309 RepID=A0AAD5QMY0_PARTN|nr:hypothetical protein KIN20_013871 [Parelaphostrongylus tenuis]